MKRSYFPAVQIKIMRVSLAKGKAFSVGNFQGALLLGKEIVK